MDRVLSQFEDVVALSGSTWTARELLSTRQVLIKRLPDSESKPRATQALALRHPRIVPTRRWMLDGDALYLVRDWVPGINLRQTLSQPALRAFDRLHARLSPLLDALDFAHTSGIAHGAVTPENVHFRESPHHVRYLTCARSPMHPAEERDGRADDQRRGGLAGKVFGGG